MDLGERATGTREKHYNLISVIYHALHGAENCDRYASDAEFSGDERLAAFFREAQVMQTEIAERAKGMLGINPASTTLPEPGFDVEPETISGGAPPVAEVPADVPPDVSEPTTVRVPRRTSAPPSAPLRAARRSSR